MEGSGGRLPAFSAGQGGSVGEVAFWGLCGLKEGRAARLRAHLPACLQQVL